MKKYMTETFLFFFINHKEDLNVKMLNPTYGWLHFLFVFFLRSHLHGIKKYGGILDSKKKSLVDF